MNHRGEGKAFARTFSNENLCISGTAVVNSETLKKNNHDIYESPPTGKSFQTDKNLYCINYVNNLSESQCAEMTPCGTIIIRTVREGQTEAWRIEKERERNPDRFSLDKRSLTTLPILLNESKLRLLSLQHNLLTKLESRSLECLSQLVFLDVYNNQLESMASLNCLKNLRVLLLGKNRIKFIEGLDNLSKLEVLDLHGNQIVEVGGLISQKELKVLNLAGNEIKTIDSNHLKGLCSLQELNIRRNRIKQVLGFYETPQLLKLFLSNNEIASIEHMDGLKCLRNLKEIGLEGNPVCALNECTSFVVSCLANLSFIDRVPITADIIKTANEWKTNREESKMQQVAVKCSTVDVDKPENRQLQSDYSILSRQSKSGWRQSNPVRVRSASQNRVSELRTAARMSNRSVNCSSTSSFEKELGRKFPKAASAHAPDRLAKLKPANGSSFTEYDNNDRPRNKSTNFFRLPPILSPLLHRLNDDNNNNNNSNNNNINSNNNNDVVNTSIDSIKSYRTNPSSSSINMDILRTDQRLLEDNFNSNSWPCEEEDDDDDDDERDDIDEEGRSSIFEMKKKFSNDSQLISEKTAHSSMVAKYCYKHDENKQASVTMSSLSNVRSKYRTRLKKCHQRVEKVVERGNDYLVEIAGRYLNVNGKNSWKFIDRAWNVDKAADVCTVRFNAVSFDAIIPTLNKLKSRFPNAEHFVFNDTNINSLGQLNALADIQGLTSIHIVPDGNSIASKNWQNYVIFRLHHWGLRYIDNIAITDEQIALACEEYKGLGDVVLYSLPDCLLKPLLSKLRLEVNDDTSPKQWLYKADATLRDVICKEALQCRCQASLTQADECLREKGREHLTQMVTNICTSVDKLKMLEKTWPSILHKLIRETLIDFDDMKTYVNRKKKDLDI